MIELRIWSENAHIKTHVTVDGNFGEIFEELSTGAAHTLIDLMDSVQGTDRPYDAMTRTYCVMVENAVRNILTERQTEDKQEGSYNGAH